MDPSRIFFTVGYAHIASCAGGAYGFGDVIAGVARAVRSAPANCAMDISDMAICVSDWRAHLFHALPLVQVER